MLGYTVSVRTMKECLRIMYQDINLIFNVEVLGLKELNDGDTSN